MKKRFSKEQTDNVSEGRLFVRTKKLKKRFSPVPVVLEQPSVPMKRGAWTLYRTGSITAGDPEC